MGKRIELEELKFLKAAKTVRTKFAYISLDESAKVLSNFTKLSEEEIKKFLTNPKR